MCKRVYCAYKFLKRRAEGELKIFMGGWKKYRGRASTPSVTTFQRPWTTVIQIKSYSRKLSRRLSHFTSGNRTMKKRVPGKSYTVFLVENRDFLSNCKVNNIQTIYFVEFFYAPAWLQPVTAAKIWYKKYDFFFIFMLNARLFYSVDCNYMLDDLQYESQEFGGRAKTILGVIASPLWGRACTWSIAENLFLIPAQYVILNAAPVTGNVDDSNAKKTRCSKMENTLPILRLSSGWLTKSKQAPPNEVALPVKVIFLTLQNDTNLLVNSGWNKGSSIVGCMEKTFFSRKFLQHLEKCVNWCINTWVKIWVL